MRCDCLRPAVLAKPIAEAAAATARKGMSTRFMRIQLNGRFIGDPFCFGMFEGRGRGASSDSTRAGGRRLEGSDLQQRATQRRARA